VPPPIGCAFPYHLESEILLPGKAKARLTNFFTLLKLRLPKMYHKSKEGLISLKSYLGQDWPKIQSFFEQNTVCNVFAFQNILNIMNWESNKPKWCKNFI
jgi:hypothetical protein